MENRKANERRGFIPLAAGHHPIRVAFFEGPGDDQLEVAYEGPGIPRQPIPAAALFRKPDRP